MARKSKGSEMTTNKRYQQAAIDCFVRTAERCQKARGMNVPDAWELILRAQAQLQNEIAVRLSDALHDED